MSSIHGAAALSKPLNPEDAIPGALLLSGLPGDLRAARPATLSLIGATCFAARGCLRGAWSNSASHLCDSADSSALYWRSVPLVTCPAIFALLRFPPCTLRRRVVHTKAPIHPWYPPRSAPTPPRARSSPIGSEAHHTCLSLLCVAFGSMLAVDTARCMTHSQYAVAGATVDPPYPYRGRARLFTDILGTGATPYAADFDPGSSLSVHARASGPPPSLDLPVVIGAPLVLPPMHMGTTAERLRIVHELSGLGRLWLIFLRSIYLIEIY
ncbi:hypothetical protein DFH09DRAFT_1347536 [Mycena vulgaris]|nr:hypothetical protein DFH09DRAFT_1347536 [Mycena vulgaris]